MLPLLRDGLARSEALQFDVLLQVLDEIRRKIRKHGNAAEMIFESPAAVSLVELRAEGFVLEHDVENISQHFEGDDLRLRDHGGGSRIKIHARHFAEEIAGAQFRDRVPVRKID